MIGHHDQMQVTEEERVYLDLQFQRDESLPRWGHREARGKHCSGGRMGELTSPTTAQSGESKLEVGKPFQSQRQAPSVMVFVCLFLLFFAARLKHLHLSKNAAN